MSALPGLLALAAILAAGVGLTEHAFAWAPVSRSDRALRATLALGLGAGVWSLGFVVAVLLFGLSSTVVLGKDGVLFALGIALFASARRRRTNAPSWGQLPAPKAPPAPRPAGEPSASPNAPAPPAGRIPLPGEPASSLLGALVTLATALALVLLVERFCAHPEGSWDALAIWNHRARFLLLGEGRAFAGAFAPVNAHADYPLLVPACVAQAWRWTQDSPSVAAAVGVVFLGVAVLSLGLLVARRRGSDAGLGVALVLLGAPSFTTLAVAQIADVPLAAFLAIALGLVVLSFEEGERTRERLALAGLAAGLGACTKNEGVLFLGALGVALALTRAQADEPRRESLRRALVFLLGALAPLAVLAWLKIGWAPRNDILAGLGGALERVTDLRRPVTILRATAEEATRVQRWGLGVLASPLLLVAFGRTRPSLEPAARVAAIVAAVAAAGFFAVYVVTPLDLAWHLEHSLERLVVQLLPAWLLLVFLSLEGARDRDLVYPLPS